MEYNKIEIGERIHQLRINMKNEYRKNKKGLSQEEFCAKYHIGRNRLSDIENGDKLPDLDLVTKLCKDCNCDIGFIFCGYEERNLEIHNLVSETGLSEKAITNLLSIDYQTRDILSAIIENENAFDLLHKIFTLKALKQKEKENTIVSERVIETNEYSISRSFNKIVDQITE